jgi:hypothetical protein
MVYSSRLTVVANGNNLTGIGLAPGETICFGSLEFTADCFRKLSLSPKGCDSGAVFVRMVHRGSLCLHTVLEDSPDESDTGSSRGGSFGSLDPRGCNVVIPIVSISTTPMLEDTLVLLTTLTVPLQTSALQLGTALLSEQ